MSWLEGRPLLDYKSAPLEQRNELADAMYRAWWYPVSHYGVIHGDPHLGNYSVFEDPRARYEQRPYRTPRWHQSAGLRLRAQIPHQLRPRRG